MVNLAKRCWCEGDKCHRLKRSAKEFSKRGICLARSRSMSWRPVKNHISRNQSYVTGTLEWPTLMARPLLTLSYSGENDALANREGYLKA